MISMEMLCTSRFNACADIVEFMCGSQNANVGKVCGIFSGKVGGGRGL